MNSSKRITNEEEYLQIRRRIKESEQALANISGRDPSRSKSRNHSGMQSPIGSRSTLTYDQNLVKQTSRPVLSNGGKSSSSKKDNPFFKAPSKSPSSKKIPPKNKDEDPGDLILHEIVKKKFGAGKTIKTVEIEFVQSKKPLISPKGTPNQIKQKTPRTPKSPNSTSKISKH